MLARCDEPDLDSLARRVLLASIDTGSDRPSAARRRPVVVPCDVHASASRADVPERKSEEWKSKLQVTLRGLLSELSISKIWRLNEIVHTQPSRKPPFVVNAKLVVRGVGFTK